MAGGWFKGLGWFLCGVVVAPACYMVTSQGAAERQRLHAVEMRIAQAKKDIRGLETEFRTRPAAHTRAADEAGRAAPSLPGGGPCGPLVRGTTPAPAAPPPTPAPPPPPRPLAARPAARA